jgi:6-phosphogluconolactonase (cycloisomerase 2 family)
VHRASALRIDPRFGDLTPRGEGLSLVSRPIHASVDRYGEYLLIAYNNPSNVTVHRIEADGRLGAEVNQAEKPDAGIYAHQILTTPVNHTAVLVARGNDAAPGRAEDPGSLKIYGFDAGRLSSRATVAPADGFGFGPRHLDFHPTGPWVFVSIERQNRIHVYRIEANGDISPVPLFVRSSLASPQNVRGLQQAGAIHVHPSGRFVYQTNRNSTTKDTEGRQVFAGGENNIAVYAIDERTGEPTPLEHVDAAAHHLRTFSIDPSGRLLVAASIMPMKLSDGSPISAGLLVYRIGEDGRLGFLRRDDVDVGSAYLWWSGMLQLPLQ